MRRNDMTLLQECCFEESAIEYIKQFQKRQHLSAEGRLKLKLLLEKHEEALHNLLKAFDL
jgi:hypothetical protein